jgi:hypothetical protein
MERVPICCIISQWEACPAGIQDPVLSAVGDFDMRALLTTLRTFEVRATTPISSEKARRYRYLQLHIRIDYLATESFYRFHYGAHQFPVSINIGEFEVQMSGGHVSWGHISPFWATEIC